MPYAHPENVRQRLAAAPGVSGNLALGAAVAGYAALKAAHDGLSFVVSLRDGLAWEVRRDCVYDHDTLTLTRGTLVDSSSGAAVDLGAGTVLRVGPSGYEADRLLPADLDGSGNALRLVDANGNKYALLPLDANDNVLANIGHRQNTLANLLALDGIPGEISVATDVDALVLHNGVAGEAKAFRRDRYVGTIIARGTTITVPSGTLTTMQFNAVSPEISNDAGGLVDGSTPGIYLPASARLAVCTADVKFSASSGGTYRRVRLYKGGTTLLATWLNTTPHATQSIYMNLTWVVDLADANFVPGLPPESLIDTLRVRVQHDAGVDLSVTLGQFSVQVYE